MAKQKEAAAARDAAASATPTIQSPWQGAAMIGNTISAGVREGRAANQEAQARQQLADLMAKVGHGGSTPEMEAQIAVLDPELAKQYRQEAIDARTRADEAKAVIDAREDTQAFQGGENAATRAVTTSEGAPTGPSPPGHRTSATKSSASPPPRPSGPIWRAKTVRRRSARKRGGPIWLAKTEPRRSGRRRSAPTSRAKPIKRRRLPKPASTTGLARRTPPGNWKSSSRSCRERSRRPPSARNSARSRQVPNSG